MSTCPQCGTPAKPTDRFCNVCGTPIVRAATPAPQPQNPANAGVPPQPGFGGPRAPAPQPGGFGGPAPARCQMGHEISPGASYCAHGHPIALDQMQFAADPYAGAGQGAFGAAPPPPAPGFGWPPAGGGMFGSPQAAPGFRPSPGYGPAPAYGPTPVPPAAPPPQAYTPPPAAAQAAPGTPSFGADAGPAGGRILRGFLVAYGANPNGEFWPLHAGRIVLGRHGTGDGVDIAVQDPTISSRHAALLVDAASGSVTVEDTGSTNGTFVNDEHIGFNGRRELRDGDRIRFGGYMTVVKVIGRV